MRKFLEKVKKVSIHILKDHQTKLFHSEKVSFGSYTKNSQIKNKGEKNEYSRS